MSAPRPDRTAPTRILVLGGGFAGLEFCKHLRAPDLEITLIDRQNHHLFQPLLYQVAVAGLSGPDIAQPLRSILRHRDDIRVRLGTVTRIDLDSRRVHLADDAACAPPSRLISPPKPFANCTDRESGSSSTRCSFSLRENDIVFAEPATSPGPGAAPSALRAGVIRWATGVSASPLARSLGAAVDRAGRLKVQPDLSLPGHPEVFALGDIASVALSAARRALVLRGGDGAPRPARIKCPRPK